MRGKIALRSSLLALRTNGGFSNGNGDHLHAPGLHRRPRHRHLPRPAATNHLKESVLRIAYSVFHTPLNTQYATRNTFYASRPMIQRNLPTRILLAGLLLGCTTDLLFYRSALGISLLIFVFL